MRNNQHLLVIGLMAIVLMAGCSSAGLMTSLHNPKGQLIQAPIKKIICINPVYSSDRRKNMSASNAIVKYEKQNAMLQKLLAFNAKKAKLDLQIIDGNHLQATDQGYFNDLAPLLNEMVIAIIGQGDYSHTVMTASSETKKRWELSPLIDSRFSVLGKKYGTPYFMFAVLKKKGHSRVHTVWQAIVVNVEAGTLHRAEYRLTTLKPKRDIMDSMFYDFFNILCHAEN